MKNVVRFVVTVAILPSLLSATAHAGTSRYDTASERYIESVIDRYVTAYGDALDGDAKARKRVDLMNRVYPYQIMDKAKIAAFEMWGVLITENANR